MKKICCWGTFDLLHEGHKKFLKNAKKLGDHLVVIVVSDKVVLENKGRMPIDNQKKRAENLQLLTEVDQIMLSKGCESALSFIKKLNPSIFVLGYDQEIKSDILIEHLEKLNISIKKLRKYAKGICTTHLIENGKHKNPKTK
ncbi:adenylyltransferase/cytidyltransferase family protein [Nanoarchaeota archaeon]